MLNDNRWNGPKCIKSKRINPPRKPANFSLIDINLFTEVIDCETWPTNCDQKLPSNTTLHGARRGQGSFVLHPPLSLTLPF